MLPRTLSAIHRYAEELNTKDATNRALEEGTKKVSQCLNRSKIISEFYHPVCSTCIDLSILSIGSIMNNIFLVNSVEFG